jgi:uncharacterized protein with PIN domain
MYANSVCVKCNRFMTKKKNGAVVLLGVHKQHIHADLSECPKCKGQIIHKWANSYCDCDVEIDYRVP